MEIHGNHWKSKEIYRKSMENNGNQWKSMEIMGFFWKSIEIYRNPLEINGKSFGLFLPVKSLSILLRILKTHTGVFSKNILHKQKERSGLKIKVVRITSSGETSFNPFEKSQNPHRSDFKNYPSQAERKEWIKNKRRSEYFFW